MGTPKVGPFGCDIEAKQALVLASFAALPSDAGVVALVFRSTADRAGIGPARLAVSHAALSRSAAFRALFSSEPW
jgi:hypothetical protein